MMNRQMKIRTEEASWYQVCELGFADWLCFKNRALCAAAVTTDFYCRPIKETEKALRFEVTRFTIKGQEVMLYHRWTFWSPKSAIKFINVLA